MLSTFDDDESRAQGLRACAVDYLLKDAPLAAIVDAIRSAAQRDRLNSRQSPRADG
jgi:DNA-binding NarL/FixJ family response regulator